MPEKTKSRRSGFKISLRLIGLVRPMLPVMFAAILMGTVGFLCAIFITTLGGFAILDGLGMVSSFPLPVLFTLMAVFALLRGILRYAEQAANHYIAFKVLALIRDKVFKALRRLAPAKLETKDKGNLISIITTDIELMEVFYAHTISPVAIATLVSSFMLVFVARYHWVFATILLCGYLVTGIIIPVLISKLGQQTGMEYRIQSGILGSTLLDSLRGLREVLQFRQGENQLAEIQRHTELLSEKQRRMKQYEGLTAALSNAAILLFSLLVLFSGILLYQAGVISFGGAFISFVASISSFGPVVTLANLSNNLLQTFASADRVLDILDEVPVTPEITNGENVAFTSLVCKNISFGYNNEPVLSGFDLTIPKGKIMGIRGKSGSGKSTFLRLIMRFWDVDSGEILISGTNIRQINTNSLRQNQGFFTQETVLFHDTLENNIKIANLNASHAQVEDACKKASIHTFIQSLPSGYSTMAGELGDTLSGGERQRIGLARIFLQDAPLLLLDEPTANLDSLNEGIILRSLEKESEGKTVILSSHRASSLRIAHDVLHVERGKIS